MIEPQLQKAHAQDAGWDLIATHDAKVFDDAVTAVYTGVVADIPSGHVGLACPRSGLAMREGIFVVNGPGVVDAGYTGEIVVLLSKVGRTIHHIRAGDKVAQLVVVPLSSYIPGGSSDRGASGFGSSGR